jgi:hypothetical protein
MERGYAHHHCGSIVHPLTTRGVLCCAQVGDDGLRALTELRHTLTTLTLKGCERITDDGLEMLAQCPHLTALDVSGCAEVRPLTHQARLRARVPRAILLRR